ncbi:hypothetical protein PsorP6_010525 [Peronosclerospora sorghi]|uniref:Uncharacterized protein n=1 Tax=Peronosclerospora sorghi TaxID=230839 RepID=A0ACC0VV14_9STRA|nr:hypothetical protein PsorP6_010525 [Peronosclerospora sorghi]
MQLQTVVVMVMATFLYNKESMATSHTSSASNPDQDADRIDNEDRGLRGLIFKFTKSRGTPFHASTSNFNAYADEHAARTALLASTSDLNAYADGHVAQTEKSAEEETSDASQFLSAYQHT